MKKNPDKPVVKPAVNSAAPVANVKTGPNTRTTNMAASRASAKAAVGKPK